MITNMKTISTFLGVLLLLSSASVQSKAQTLENNQPTVEYKVGDYYNHNGKEGVVFEVDATGTHGKIVSLTKSEKTLAWSTFEQYTKNLHGPIGTTSEDDGRYNLEQISAIKDWQNKFPAFAWCTDLGEGWYLPAIKELEKLMEDETVSSVVNQTLQSKGTALFDGGVSQYWSSTQYGKYMALCWFYRDGGNTTNLHKYYTLPVRAIAVF